MDCSSTSPNHDFHPVVTAGPHDCRVQIVDIDSSPIGNCGESTLGGVLATSIDVGALFPGERNEPVVLAALDVHY